MTTTTLIYGAGNMGREVLAGLRSRGVQPAAFIDRRGAELGVVEGVPVLGIPEAAAAYGEVDPDVIVAVHSWAAPVAEIVDTLRALGFRGVRTFWQFCRDERWLPALPYWLAPHFDWEAHAADIAEARALLADEASRAVFDQQIALRRHGDYAGVGSPRQGEQYTPTDVPPWRLPVRLIDCGAYDGDTIRLMEERGFPVADVVAFEPDRANFVRLEKYLRELGRGRALCAGAFDRGGELRFASGLGTAAHADSNGDSVIAVARIDDVLGDLEPNLCKMDIEGAEGAALEGARQTIEQHRPGLAISVYHRPEDPWAILLQVHRWDLGYRFYLRSHAFNGFETVLYGVAE